jgi:zinc D-Ala-D-Ala carboxypeptidase
VTRSEPARATIYRTRIRWVRVAALLVVVAAIAAVLGYQLLASSPSPASSTAPAASPIGIPHSELPPLPIDQRGALGETDGAVPDGTTVFDDHVPGVAKLHPQLLRALREAATDAAGDGAQFVVDSGWRSPRYQEQLLSQAIAKYGSEAQATRWVAPPERSSHVKGDAVDLGPAAASWLSAHGAAYGLCQIYANEPWHYELRPEAVDHGCPAVYADPTHDPRMQR